MSEGLNARRAAALRVLADRPNRPARAPSRFPGETQPSDGLPGDPILAARILNARYAGRPVPEDTL